MHERRRHAATHRKGKGDSGEIEKHAIHGSFENKLSGRGPAAAGKLSRVAETVS
jgi:hypothetical protein